MKGKWPLSRQLLMEILSDHISDGFLNSLIWERLGYVPSEIPSEEWVAGDDTPTYWKEKFPKGPKFLSERPPSIYLTKSIPRAYKQGLKEVLGFKGYSIKELFPRRTRRATAVNWLIAWSLAEEGSLPEKGPLPDLLNPPADPSQGHDESKQNN